MVYYEFCADTEYCGTEDYFYEKFETEPSREELEQMAMDFAIENASNYDYIVTGWDYDEEDEEMQEELQYYYEGATCSYKKITKEEYEENASF